jgi:hypothetical protein
MSKIIPAELRWLQVDNKKVLQQRCFYEWSNEYHWEDIEVVNEIDKTPKEKIQAEIDCRIEAVTNLELSKDKKGCYNSITDICVQNRVSSLNNEIKCLELALTYLK